MFDATFTNCILLKKIIAALSDVLKDVTFECCGAAMKVMGMDASHVALVNLLIVADDQGPLFSAYRCDQPMALSFSVEVLAKILKTLGNDDSVQFIVRPDVANKCEIIGTNKESKRKTSFDVTLLDLEGEHLGVPDAEYESEVQMPSGEFAKLMRDLSIHGESLKLNLTQQELQFTVAGDNTKCTMQLEQRMPKLERELEEAIENDKTAEIKDEAVTQAEDEDEEGKEDVEMGEDDEGVSLEKIKAEKKPKKEAKEKKNKDIEKEKQLARMEAKAGDDPNLSRIAFVVEQPVEAIYSLRYMNMFAKAAPLGNYVKLSVSGEQPIVVMFPLEDEKRGHLSFYLAPKIDE